MSQETGSRVHIFGATHINTAIHGPQAVLKYEAEVAEDGQVALQVPFAPGARVVIFVIPEHEEQWNDLTTAAGTSLAFWDNPLDDEDWNDA